MTDTNEIDVWENEVPVVIPMEDSEFSTWENEVPVENQGPPDTGGRRRFFMF